MQSILRKRLLISQTGKLVYLNLCSQEILHRWSNTEPVRVQESNSSAIPVQPLGQSEQIDDGLPTDPDVWNALRNAGLISDSPPSSPHISKEEALNDATDSTVQNEWPDNILEMDSDPEIDIYGDFEYDLEDEDYIGVASMKVPKVVPPDEGESKVKVVFSTFKSERSNEVHKLENNNEVVETEESKHSPTSSKGNTDIGTSSAVTENVMDKSCASPELVSNEEGEEPSLAECEELYGPDKEPLIQKFPEQTSGELHGSLEPECSAETKVPSQLCQNTSDVENLSNHSRTSENVPKKDKSKTENNKQSDAVNSVSKKVENYIKEHIRPLCKSGIITVEQYRWAVAKTTDKVMKYHLNAKSANFLIKEGDKVKKHAEQYIESAQQKEKSDLL